MTRFPLAAVAVLAAGLVLAACGSTSTQHRPRSGPPTPTVTAKIGAKATPTPTEPLSGAAAEEAGFKAWAQATVLLTGGGPSGLPVSSMPEAEADIMLIDHGLHLPGWLRSLGQGNVLTEVPARCQAAIFHVAGAFVAPANAPKLAGAGKIALVVRFHGACTTEAGGVKYLTDTASGAESSGTMVLLGSEVALPPVPGLSVLPAEVWAPVYFARSACSVPWVEYAGSLLGSGAVPGC